MYIPLFHLVFRTLLTRVLTFIEKVVIFNRSILHSLVCWVVLYPILLSWLRCIHFVTTFSCRFNVKLPRLRILD